MTTQQKAMKLFPSSDDLRAPLTARDALAAIETFEIVGENNDSREPNGEDRFILTEYIAHLFGGYRYEQPATALPPTVLNVLRFYANGGHFNIDSDHQDFDTVSGEPSNWLFSTRDDDTTMIEDGSLAKAVLCGRAFAMGEPEQPVEGEVFGVMPAAAPIDDEQRIEAMARAMNVATDGHDRYWTGFVPSAGAALRALRAMAAVAPADEYDTEHEQRWPNAETPAPADDRAPLPRYTEWLHLRTHGEWSDGVPAWARDHTGRMNDFTAATAVIEELAARAAASPAAVIPAGWKPMPPMLTSEMRMAIAKAAAEYMRRTGGNSPDTIYEAAFAAAPQPAQADAPAAAREPVPSLTNPLTPYGMLVRALRIVSGTTLMDMAKALLTTPAKLSAMEFGREPVTLDFALDVAAYFDALGVPDTLVAIRRAIDAARTGVQS